MRSRVSALRFARMAGGIGVVQQGHGGELGLGGHVAVPVADDGHHGGAVEGHLGAFAGHRMGVADDLAAFQVKAPGRHPVDDPGPGPVQMDDRAVLRDHGLGNLAAPRQAGVLGEMAQFAVDRDGNKRLQPH